MPYLPFFVAVFSLPARRREDTYLFHKSRLLANRIALDDPSLFERENTSFYMNERGAENAALHDIAQLLNISKVWNACPLIRSWHFHLKSKTRKDRTWKTGLNKKFVPEPWLDAPTPYCGPLSDNRTTFDVDDGTIHTSSKTDNCISWGKQSYQTNLWIF